MNVYRKVSRSAVTWLCSALLAASGHAWAEDWWVVHKGDDPAELDVFLADADSLAPVPGIENAWQVQIAMLFDSFHLLSAHQYRCDKREVKVVNAKTFLQQRATHEPPVHLRQGLDPAAQRKP